MKKISVFFFFLISINVLGQDNYIKLAGRVIDKESKESINHVNIFVCGKALGTSTNDEGEFLLKIPAQLQNGFICISRLGYQSQKLAISNILQKKSVLISLVANTQELDEIFISDMKMPKPKGLVEKVFRKFKKNYPYKNPYLLETYYRDYLEKDNKKTHILESAIAMYDPSFRLSSDELRMKIYQSKVTNGHAINYQEYYENNIGAKQGKLFVYGGNQLTVLNFNNPIRNFNRIAVLKTGYELDAYFQQNHDFALDEVSYIDDIMLYHVEIKANQYHPYFTKVFRDEAQKHELTGEIWIRADNFAIQKFIYTLKIGKKIVNKTEMEYQLIGKKMYPKYLAFHNSIEIIEDEISNTYVHHRELFVNEVKVKTIPSPETFQLFDTIDAFHNSNHMSNHSFWDKYNTIKLEDE